MNGGLTGLSGLGGVSALFAAMQVASPPAAPVVTAGAYTDTTMALSWSAVTGATSYKVQFSVHGSGSWTTFSTPIGTSDTITGLTGGVNYDFRVLSTGAGGDSGASNIIPTPFYLWDSFTDTNGTALTAHTPEIGSPPTIIAGTWIIQGNAARCSNGSVAAVNGAPHDAGQANVVVKTQVTVASGGGTFAYIYLNYVNDNENWVLIWFGTSIQIYEITGGVPVMRAIQTIAMINDGDSVAAVGTSNDDTISLLVKTVTVSYNVLNRSNKTATKHGMRTYQSWAQAGADAHLDYLYLTIGRL